MKRWGGSGHGFSNCVPTKYEIIFISIGSIPAGRGHTSSKSGPRGIV